MFPVAVRRRVSTATVLLTMSGNRFRARYDSEVASLNQINLCHLDLPHRPAAAGPGGFAELLARTWQASLSAHRYAYYDPVAMAQAFAGQGHDLASAPRVVLLRQRSVAATRIRTGANGSARATHDDDRMKLLSWDAAPARFAWRCRFQVMDASDGVSLVVTAVQIESCCGVSR